MEICIFNYNNTIEIKRFRYNHCEFFIQLIYEKNKRINSSNKL